MTALLLRPLVLIGPSGAGKSTVADYLTRAAPAKVIPTVTTRPARSSEQNTTHTFVDSDTFAAMRENDEFIGTTHIFGHDYGLPQLPDTDEQLIILLRAPFVQLFKSAYPSSLVVQLEAPLPVLIERLTQRGSQDRADIASLKQEIALGRQVADMLISTDQPIDVYAGAILAELTVAW